MTKHFLAVGSLSLEASNSKPAHGADGASSQGSKRQGGAVLLYRIELYPAVKTLDVKVWLLLYRIELFPAVKALDDKMGLCYCTGLNYTQLSRLKMTRWGCVIVQY